MKLIPMSIESMGPGIMPEEDVLVLVGAIAGECYNSDKSQERCIQRALNCIKRGHHSPWEHANITLKCTVDRGVSHALVRHRHCAFQQSSTIYQRFQELEFIDGHVPCDAKLSLYEQAEQRYKELLADGLLPSSARDVLPNALATNLIITTNVRQWMYMIQRRCGPGDSDNMHAWCQMTRDWFLKYYPKVTKAFDVWYEEHPL